MPRHAHPAPAHTPRAAVTRAAPQHAHAEAPAVSRPRPCTRADACARGAQRRKHARTPPPHLFAAVGRLRDDALGLEVFLVDRRLPARLVRPRRHADKASNTSESRECNKKMIQFFFTTNYRYLRPTLTLRPTQRLDGSSHAPAARGCARGRAPPADAPGVRRSVPPRLPLFSSRPRLAFPPAPQPPCAARDSHAFGVFDRCARVSPWAGCGHTAPLQCGARAMSVL